MQTAMSIPGDPDGGPPTLQRQRTVAEALTAPSTTSESTRTPSSTSDNDQVCGNQHHRHVGAARALCQHCSFMKTFTIRSQNIRTPLTHLYAVWLNHACL